MERRSSNGARLWTKTFPVGDTSGTPYPIKNTRMAVDTDGFAHITFSLIGILTTGGQTFTSSSRDVVYLRLSPVGDVDQKLSFGTPWDEEGTAGIVVNGSAVYS